MHIQNQIKEFLTSTNSKVLIITGSAGTGKTTLIRQIITQLNDLQSDYYLLAPTGRASQILHNHIFETAEVSPTTIHSFLYTKNKDSINDIPEILEFAIRDDKIEENSVVIIDEASMLSHEVSNEKNFLKFGSGNLFKDLTDYLDLSHSQRKLILLRDPCQLPPLNVSTAEILNPEFVKGYLNTPHVQHIHLTKVHRQLQESLILKSAISLRDALDQKSFLQLPIETNQSEVCDLKMNEALEKYLWDYGNSSIFLSYTNKDVHNINLNFRELLHLSPQKLEKKERLVLMKNSWVNSQYLYNGDFLIVETLGDIENIPISFPLKDGQSFSTNLSFQSVELRKENEHKSIHCKILVNKLWSEEADLSLNDLRAFVVHFQKRNSHLKRGSDEYKRAIQNDPYINALYVRFGYAMTCHKAQGGEWDNVYINLARPQNDLKTVNGFKWAYTALTRSKKHVYLMNRPLNKINFDPQSPFAHFINEIETHLVSFGYKLVSTKSLDYELQLLIEKDSISSSFKLYRNKKMQITSIMPMKKSIHSKHLETVLNTFVNKSLVEN